MKYMLFKNKEYIKSDIFKYFFGQLIITVVFLLVNYNVIEELGNTFIYTFLGWSKYTKLGPFNLLLKALNISVVVYITFKVFLNSVENSTDNTLLRINKNKMLFVNMISCLIFVIIMRIVLISIITLIFMIFGSTLSFNFFMLCLLSDLVNYIFISLFVIFIINLVSLNFFGKIISLVLVMLLVMFDFLNTGNLVLLICIIVLFVLNFLCFKPNKISNLYF